MSVVGWQNNATPSDITRLIDAYSPKLASVRWDPIKEIVLTSIHAACPETANKAGVLLSHFTRYVDWLRSEGLGLDRATVFDGDHMETYAARLATERGTSQATLASLLGQVARAAQDPSVRVGVARADVASMPYTDAEIQHLASWAQSRKSPDHRANGMSVLALGLGAGLPANELQLIRNRDVQIDGSTDRGRVTVPGGRTVELRSEWVPMLRRSLQYRDNDELLFTYARFSRSRRDAIARFARHAGLAEAKLNSERLRSTYIVTLLNERVAIDVLLDALGVGPKALARYLPYLSTPVEQALDMLRGAEAAS